MQSIVSAGLPVIATPKGVTQLTYIIIIYIYIYNIYIYICFLLKYDKRL